jgi:ketosteroid isomerase-like protein
MTLSTAAVAATPQPAAEARRGIQAVLDASAAAWSAGDLDRFMTCYVDAPTTTYVSGAHFVQGYPAIRAMYAERFGGGSRAAMGQLSLEILNLRLIDARHAYVVGRFHLRRAVADGGDASGLTTLIFERIPAGWRIVADHS